MVALRVKKINEDSTRRLWENKEKRVLGLSWSACFSGFGEGRKGRRREVARF